MATYIPAPLMDHIEATLGHNDYAPYVLDGQTADDDGDYHDVVTVVEAGPGRYGVIKWTMHPDGEITHYGLA